VLNRNDTIKQIDGTGNLAGSGFSDFVKSDFGSGQELFGALCAAEQTPVNLAYQTSFSRL
jgi:hypothetical protein